MWYGCPHPTKCQALDTSPPTLTVLSGGLWVAHSPSCCAGQATIKAEPTDSLVSPVRTMAIEALSHLR